MKIIFSRKGFDSSLGGVASPIFPAGDFRSLPIPSTHGIQLKQVGDCRHDLGTVVHDLTRGKLTGESLVHLDPDLAAASLERKPGWRPLFGQAGAAQGHLVGQGIRQGDVFVFYGWFRQVDLIEGTYRYRKHAPDLHVVFGWLQIERAYRAGDTHEVPAWALYHPHFVRRSVYQNDTVYVATDRLVLPHHETRLPGAGTFDTFGPGLCLTQPGALRSLWRLPAWFYPDGRKPLTYHRDPARWHRTEDELLLNVVSQGQEFVLDCDEYPEALEWLLSLFSAWRRLTA